MQEAATQPALLSFQPDADAIVVDLDVLVTSKMLIQANSGGGKSYALRYLLEQTYGRVPQIVFDPEGEFASLREQFAYVLAGVDGDVPARPELAGPLCRRLVELGASAVLDLYDLDFEERELFVKNFLNELLSLPRRLWRPLLVIIDEAHLFCPEKGTGTAVSKPAVAGLSTRGRKRGFCAVLATQRLANLDKTVAAELHNVLIGRTGLDVDLERAGKTLGFGNDSRGTLPHLDPGVFYAFGPAISREVVRVRTGQVRTSHPSPGQIVAPAPPPPDQLRALIAQLADLSAQVDSDADPQFLQRRIAELEHDLRERPAPVTIQVPVLTVEDVASLRLAASALETSAKVIAKYAGDILAGLDRVAAAPTLPTVQLDPPQERVPAPAVLASAGDSTVQLRAGERKMLDVLARRHPLKLTRAQLATLAGFAPKGGTFGTYFSTLKRAGFLEEINGEITVTLAGLAHLGYAEPPAPLTTAQILAQWRAVLRAGERKMLDELVAIYPRGMKREQLAERTGYEETGGTFGTYLGTLRRNGLIETFAGSVLRASSALFLGDGGLNTSGQQRC